MFVFFMNAYLGNVSTWWGNFHYYIFLFWVTFTRGGQISIMNIHQGTRHSTCLDLIAWVKPRALSVGLHSSLGAHVSSVCSQHRPLVEFNSAVLAFQSMYTYITSVFVIININYHFTYCTFKIFFSLSEREKDHVLIPATCSFIFYSFTIYINVTSITFTVADRVFGLSLQQVNQLLVLSVSVLYVYYIPSLIYFKILLYVIRALGHCIRYNYTHEVRVI